jgi:hypothetical protein
MEKLLELLNIQNKLTPLYQNKDFLRIRCYCDFEPFGRASETWEEVWELVLPQHSSYWFSAGNWHKYNSNAHMYFEDRSLDAVISRAIVFLEWYNKNGQ